jgi:hypothetical protein
MDAGSGARQQQEVAMANIASNLMRRALMPAAVLGAALLMAAPAGAQGMGQGGGMGMGTGPVGKMCANELTKYCAGVPHGAGKARACLDANRDKVSDNCRWALDNTGAGRGMGRGQQTPN